MKIIFVLDWAENLVSSGGSDFAAGTAIELLPWIMVSYPYKVI